LGLIPMISNVQVRKYLYERGIGPVGYLLALVAILPPWRGRRDPWLAGFLVAAVGTVAACGPGILIRGHEYAGPPPPPRPFPAPAACARRRVGAPPGRVSSCLLARLPPPGRGGGGGGGRRAAAPGGHGGSRSPPSGWGCGASRPCRRPPCTRRSGVTRPPP